MSTSITVSSSDEIFDAVAALVAAGGGTLKLAASDIPYNIDLSYAGSDTAPVTITSADPDDPAIIATTEIYRSKGIALDGLRFETGTTDGQQDIQITQSRSISITNSTMQGVADGFWDPDSEATRGDDLILIRDSDTIVFSNNTVSGYFHGIGLLNNVDVTIANNDISGIQGDGIRGGGQTSLLIENNYLHDFYGTLQSVTHTDMIQLWGSYTDSPNTDVTITGNVLFSGDGAATQGILIRNEVFGEDSASGGYFQDITITNNIIYNGARNGIYVADTAGLVVEDNSLFWDMDAVTQSDSGSTPGTSSPWLNFYNIESGTVTGNISGNISGDGTLVPEAGSNLTAVYGSANEQNANYIGELVMAYDTVTALPQDFLIDPDSDIYGVYGANPAMPWLVDDAEDSLALAVDVDLWSDHLLAVTLTAHAYDAAGTEINFDTATVVWRLADGTELTGRTVDVAFDTYGETPIEMIVTTAEGETTSLSRVLELQDPILVALDFEGDLEDQGSRDTTSYLTGSETAAYVTGHDGNGFHLTDGTQVQVERTTSYIHGLNRFQIDMDLRTDDPDGGGTLLEMFGAFGLDLEDGGALSFWLQTDAGKFEVVSNAGILGDTDWHTISVIYDSSAESLQIVGDGVVLAETTATGTTSQDTIYPLVLGSSFNSAADAVFDNLVFSKPASYEALVRLGELEPDSDVGSDTGTDVTTGTETDPPTNDSFLFEFEFEDGLYDSSLQNTRANISGVSSGALDVAGVDGSGMKIGANTTLNINRENDHISDLDSFVLGISVQKDSADGSGGLMTIHNTLDLDVLEDGALRFWMATDTGNTYGMLTEAGLLSDTEWHEVELQYSDEDDQLLLLLDGTVVGSTEATGTAPQISYWGLEIGDSWKGSLEATVDNLYMSTFDSGFI